MYCTKCGGANSENTKFCNACGEELIQREAQQKSEDQTEDSVNTQNTHIPPGAWPAPQAYVALPVYFPDFMPLIPPGDKGKNWQAICGMICGIASIPMMITAFGGLFTGLAAIFFSIKGFKSQKRGMAIAGIVCGIIGLLISGFMVFTMIAGQILYPEIYQ